MHTQRPWTVFLSSLWSPQSAKQIVQSKERKQQPQSPRGEMNDFLFFSSDSEPAFVLEPITDSITWPYEEKIKLLYSGNPFILQTGLRCLMWHLSLLFIVSQCQKPFETQDFLFLFLKWHTIRQENGQRWDRPSWMISGGVAASSACCESDVARAQVGLFLCLFPGWEHVSRWKSSQPR